MTLPIVLYPDPILREVAAPVPVEEIPTYLSFARKLLHTCKVTKAYGIAAPQVGRSVRIVVTNLGIPLLWVNPKIVRSSEEVITGPEGCLSLPGKIVTVSRPTWIEVEYNDLTGHTHQELVTGRLAVVLSHEIDHLNGILITDYEPKTSEAA